MIKLPMIAAIVFISPLTASCSSAETVQQELNDHAARRALDLRIAEAIDSGDYRQAISIVRESNLPDNEKTMQAGLYIIGAYDDPTRTRPAESIAEGLDILKHVALANDFPEPYPAEQLRLIFTDGAGSGEDIIRPGASVAQCWAAVVRGARGEGASRCVALRRARMPELTVPPGTPLSQPNAN